MSISKKRLIALSSIIISVIIFAFLGTACYRYTGFITKGDFYSGYDFGFGGNVIIESFNIILVTICAILLALNLLAFFVEKVSEKPLAITNLVLWVLALAFAICAMCAKYVNESYNPTVSITFVMLLTLVGIISSFAPLFIQDKH